MPFVRVKFLHRDKFWDPTSLKVFGERRTCMHVSLEFYFLFKEGRTSRGCNRFYRTPIHPYIPPPLLTTLIQFLPTIPFPPLYLDPIHIFLSPPSPLPLSTSSKNIRIPSLELLSEFIHIFSFNIEYRFYQC